MVHAAQGKRGRSRPQSSSVETPEFCALEANTGPVEGRLHRRVCEARECARRPATDGTSESEFAEVQSG
jgi:hypothetical protein